MKIFIPGPSSLGDQWKTLNLLLRFAEIKGERITLSHFSGGNDISKKQQEILAVLDARTDLIEVGPYIGNTPISSRDVQRAELFKTKRTWEWKKKTRYVAVHFDGVSAAKDKNPPLKDKSKILFHLTNLGYQHRKLGRHQSIAEAVDQLAESAFFVGCDSGFSHIAHSVGVPVFLLQYKKPVDLWHGGSSYTLCEGADDFISKLKAWLRYRNFLGLT